MALGLTTPDAETKSEVAFAPPQMGRQHSISYESRGLSLHVILLLKGG